jgi:hypothetical protein
LIPQFLTADAKDLLNKLLKKNPVVRLGRGATGVEDIRKHAFWRVDKQPIDWERVYNKGYTPPIVPDIFLAHEEDTSNFSGIKRGL